MLDSSKAMTNDKRIEALLQHREIEEFNAAYAAGLRDYQSAFCGLMGAVRAGRVERLEEKLDKSMEKIHAFVSNYFSGRRAKTKEVSPEELGENIESLDKRRSGRR